MPGSGIQAYVPHLSPVYETEPEAPSGTRTGGEVHLLAADGSVAHAEVLSGPEASRSAAVKAVQGWKFRPVIRNGKPVPAFTDAIVFFHGDRPPVDLTGGMPAMQRLMQLESEFPRLPEQVLADLEQDSAGRDDERRSPLLNELARAAWKAGAEEEAARYANELLQDAAKDPDDSNGDALHDAHTVLGLLALRHDDLTAARGHLLDSARNSGSPVMSTFGPSMTLAKALLEKGERNVVLDYFTLCRKFWAMGDSQLTAWSDAVRAGRIPDFAMNLR